VRFTSEESHFTHLHETWRFFMDIVLAPLFFWLHYFRYGLRFLTRWKQEN
jgi:hypothetical protein